MASIRQEVLAEAEHIVGQDRNTSYGTPEQNFGRIAEMWSAYKGINFEPHDVAAMLILLKVARVFTSPSKVDHWIDIAGYAACGGEVRPDERGAS
jgi:hypothetical protein